MDKTLSSWALLALASLGPVAAHAELTIYGRMDLAITRQNGGSSALTGSNGRLGAEGRRWDLRHGSENRLGFRGVEDLGAGMKAGFQIEHRFLGDTGVADPVFWKARSYAYLERRGWGQLYLGREYIPAFWPALKLDPWAWDTVGSPSLNHQMAGYRVDGHARANNSVGWRSPVLNGFSSNLAVSAGEGARPRTVGANVEYSAGPLYLAAGVDRQGPLNRVALLGGAYDFKFIKPRLSYTSSKVAGRQARNLTLAASLPMGGQGEWKLAVARLDPQGADNTTTKLGLGYEHALSKRTALYGNLGSAGQQGRLADGRERTRTTAMDLGLKHNF